MDSRVDAPSAVPPKPSARSALAEGWGLAQPIWRADGERLA